MKRFHIVRGLFRIWVVISILFSAFLVFVFWSEGVLRTNKTSFLQVEKAFKNHTSPSVVTNELPEDELSMLTSDGEFYYSYRFGLIFRFSPEEIDELTVLQRPRFFPLDDGFPIQNTYRVERSEYDLFSSRYYYKSEVNLRTRVQEEKDSFDKIRSKELSTKGTYQSFDPDEYLENSSRLFSSKFILQNYYTYDSNTYLLSIHSSESTDSDFFAVYSREKNPFEMYALMLGKTAGTFSLLFLLSIIVFSIVTSTILWISRGFRSP